MAAAAAGNTVVSDVVEVEMVVGDGIGEGAALDDVDGVDGADGEGVYKRYISI